MGVTVPADQIHQAMRSEGSDAPGDGDLRYSEVYRNLLPLRAKLRERGWIFPGGRVDRQLRQDGKVAVEAGYVYGEVWVKALVRDATSEGGAQWRTKCEWKIHQWDPNDPDAQVRGIARFVDEDMEGGQ